MKKLLAFLLGIMMLFALVACKQPTPTPGPGPGPVPGPVIPGGEYNPRDPEQYIYKSVFANSPYKDQWETSRTGATLYDIWDSSVLPDCVPQKPDSVIEVDYTGYVGLLDYKYSSSAPGELSIYDENDEEAKPWTYFLILFYGTEDTFNTLCEEFAKKFECFDDRDTSWGENDKISGKFHAYSKDWYCYLTYSQNGSYDWGGTGDFIPDEDGAWNFSLYVMPPHHQAVMIEGIQLPQFGYITYLDKELICYEEGDDEYTFIKYDFIEGKPLETLLPNWNWSQEYYGATRDDAIAYGQSLVGQGFEKKIESFDYNGEEENYFATFEKGEMKVEIRYDYRLKCVILDFFYGDSVYFQY